MSQTKPQADPQQQNLASNFQNLQVSNNVQMQPPQIQQPQAQAFPSGLQQQQQQQQSNPFKNTQGSYDKSPWQQSPSETPQPPSQQQSNPFLRTSRSQTFQASNPWAQQAQPQPHAQNQPQFQSQASSNPFGNWQQQNVFQQPSTQSPQPIYGQQADFFLPAQPQQHTYQPQLTSQNPWAQQQQGYQNFVPQPQQQQQPQMQPTSFSPQATGAQQSQPPQQQHLPYRQDNSSILALYNLPNMAPPRPLQNIVEDQSSTQQQHQTSMSAPPSPPKPRNFTMPTVGSMNPFAPMQSATGRSASGDGRGHASHDSMAFIGMPGGDDGRHSPDAFAGLSSRYAR